MKHTSADFNVSTNIS